MQKIVFRNKFRIRNTKTGEVIRLNVKADSTGNYRFVEGFNSFMEADKALKLYKQRFRGDFTIESYPVTVKAEITKPDDQTSQVLKTLKVFSGKGLAYNTITPKKQENQYNAGTYYGREVYMYQSTERGKGLSVNKNKYKKVRHQKATVNEKFHNLTVEDSIVLSIKDNLYKFPNRKLLHKYLRDRHMSWKQVKEITSKVYA